MSEIKDGMYVVRNVANPNLSVNVKGAADGNGTNVWAYPFSPLADGGYCTVQTKSAPTTTEQTDDFTGDGSTSIFNLTKKAVSNTVKVLVNDEEVEDFTINRIRSNNTLVSQVIFGSSNVPSVGSDIKVTYYVGNEWQLLSFPATGKIVSVGVGSGGSSPSPGIPGLRDNCYQWEIGNNGIGGGEQRWFFEDTGNTITYGQKEYHTYKIWLYVTIFGSPYTPMLIDYKGYQATAESNLQLFTSDGYNDQLWFFEPVEAIFPGVYQIVTRRNSSNCMYVNGASKSAGARIGVQPYTGALNQLWYIGEANDGRVQLRPLHSFGDFATFATNTATIRDQCCQDGHSLTQTDHWWIPYPIPGKTLMVDGSSYQCYELSIYAGVGDLVADIPSADIKNWLQIYTANGTDAQLWSFVPRDAVDISLPTPSSVGISLNNKEYKSGNIEWDSESDILPIWDCPGTKFQVRYRTRIIGVSDSGTETYPNGWSDWKSVADGSPANDGWGTAWLPNQIFNTPADHKIGDKLEIEELTLTNPACDIEIEVRYFTDEWSDYNLPAHGSSASGSVRVYKSMEVSISDVTRMEKGLEVSFTSDWNTGATTAKVLSMSTADAKMMDTVTESGKYAGSDSIIIPWEDIDQHISIGDSATVNLELTTALGVSGSISYTGSVVDGGDIGVTPTYEESDHASYIVTVPHGSGETTRMLFLQKNVKPIEITPFYKSSTEDKFDLLVPLNTEGNYEVIVSGFAVDLLVLPAITSHFAVWTFGDGDWAILDWGLNQNPIQEDGQTQDVDEYQLTGRDYHTYRQRSTMNRDMTVTGAFVESMPEHGSRKALMRLMDAGHAVYRNFRGEIHNVFVSGISIPLKDTRLTEVTITQYVETR